jgi:hypothetical protein
VLLTWAVDYVGRSWSVLTFPYGYDYGEAPELQRALDVVHGQTFYTFWSMPPYHMANYPPLYSVVNGLFMRFLGVQFQSGRAIAWVCGLLFCAGLGWLAWREARTILAPVVTVLLWFSSQYVWNWTPLGREDELAMLLSLGGLIVFYEGVIRARPSPSARMRADSPSGAGAASRPRSMKPVWLAAGLFLAAIYTRQTTIEAAAACALYLLAVRPRLGLAFIAVNTLAGGLIFAALDVLTGGAFYLNVVTGNKNLFHWSRVAMLGHQFWSYYQAAAVLAGFYLVTQLLLRRQQVFTLWLLVTFAVAVTAGKEGAADNYFLQPWAAVSLCAGLAVGRLLGWSVWLWRRRSLAALARPIAVVPPLVAGFLLLLHAQLTFHLPYQGQFRTTTVDTVGAHGLNGLLRRATETAWYLRLLPAELPPRVLEGQYGYRYKPSLGASARQEQAQVDALVAAAPGDVFDEDMTHVLLAGKQIAIQPFEFSQEAQLGQWDPRPFLRRIDQGEFGLVVTTKRLASDLQFERYTPQMATALAANYCLEWQTNTYFVYRPCPGGR